MTPVVFVVERVRFAVVIVAEEASIECPVCWMMNVMDAKAQVPNAVRSVVEPANGMMRIFQKAMDETAQQTRVSRLPLRVPNGRGAWRSAKPSARNLRGRSMENVLSHEQLASIKQRVLSAYKLSDLGELARALDIPFQALQHCFLGRTPIPTKLLLRLSEETRVSIHWMLTGTGEKHPGSTQVQSQQIGSQLAERREKQRDIFNLVAQFNELPDQVKIALSNKLVGLVANYLLNACDIAIAPEPITLTPILALHPNDQEAEAG